MHWLERNFELSVNLVGKEEEGETHQAQLSKGREGAGRRGGEAEGRGPPASRSAQLPLEAARHQRDMQTAFPGGTFSNRGCQRSSFLKQILQQQN